MTEPVNYRSKKPNNQMDRVLSRQFKSVRSCFGRALLGAMSKFNTAGVRLIWISLVRMVTCDGKQILPAVEDGGKYKPPAVGCKGKRIWKRILSRKLVRTHGLLDRFMLSFVITTPSLLGAMLSKKKKKKKKFVKGGSK
jgi:hypothetical protein